MLVKTIILIFSFILANPLWAEVQCYYTLAKDNCWLAYDVTVDVMDSITAKILTTVKIPAGKPWARQTFPCEPGMTLMYRARFSPAFWEKEKDKVYMAKNYWGLPKEIKPGDSAWNVGVCFPGDFSAVPMPPGKLDNCGCKFDIIPAIPPKKI